MKTKQTFNRHYKTNEKLAVNKYAAGASILHFPCHTDHNIDESFLFIDFPRFKVAKIAA